MVKNMSNDELKIKVKTQIESLGLPFDELTYEVITEMMSESDSDFDFLQKLSEALSGPDASQLLIQKLTKH